MTKAEKFVKKTILKSALHGYFDTQKSGLLFLQLKYNNELQGNFKIDLAFPAEDFEAGLCMLGLRLKHQWWC